MEELGFNTYYMAREASTFDQETLEVEVEFNGNQSEIDLLEMEQEFGLEDVALLRMLLRFRRKS